jgi:hypothetical protein
MTRNLFILFTFLSTSAFATGQASELIIYEGDTLQLTCEPLEQFLKEHEPRKKFYIMLENGCSTALWRGYVGLWKYQDEKLYLIDVYPCGDKTKSIKKLIFKEREDHILADWYTGHLFIQKGKVIKYNHSGYDRIYEKEIVVNVEKGETKEIKTYDNGVKPDDNRFSRNPNHIMTKIYQSINWSNIPRLSKNYKLFVSFQIGENGEMINTKIESEISNSYKDEIENVLKTFPPIQVLYSRGKSSNEGWTMKIVFSRHNKRKYAR